MPNMSDTMRHEYIEDLLRARPRGPIGNRVTYRVREEWSSKKDKYVEIPEPSDDQWGYTDEQIFSLGLMDRDDVSKYVLKKWFNGATNTYSLGRKKATYTRRCNRIWERIEDIVRRVKRSGGIGIYHVREGYYKGRNDFGYIYATSPDEAKRFANMFFGYMLEDVHSLRTEFERFGTPQEVIILNAKHQDVALSRIKEWKDDIQKINANIDKQISRLETLSMIEQQQLSAELSE